MRVALFEVRLNLLPQQARPGRSVSIPALPGSRPVRRSALARSLIAAGSAQRRAYSLVVFDDAMERILVRQGDVIAIVLLLLGLGPLVAINRCRHRDRTEKTAPRKREAT